MKALTTLLVAGMFLTTIAMADDVDDVKAAVTQFYQQLNDGDLSSLAFLAPGDSFPRTGSLLEPLPPSRSEAQAAQNAGQDWNLTLRHLNAKVYGNSAVATYYTVGTVTYPDGTVVRGVHRASIMLIKQSGQWRQVHSHISRLSTPQ
jgi:ketosteroid isomerase-like protein